MASCTEIVSKSPIGNSVGTAELGPLVEDYLTACAARGLSPKTLKDSYRFPLERVFLPLCAAEGMTSAGDVNKRALDRLSVQLLERGPSGKPLSRFSVNSYLNAVNLFLGWAAREGRFGNGAIPRTRSVGSRPLTKIRAAPQGVSLVSAVSEAAAKAIVHQPPNEAPGGP